MKLNYKKGFTLAEVLTTLLVIGVIATMTIPTLVSGIDEQKNRTMIKKLYSAMSTNIQTVLNNATVESFSSLRSYGENNANGHNGILANRDYLNIESICTDCFAPDGRDKNGETIINSLLPPPMNAGSSAQSAVEEVKDADGNITQVALPEQEATNANFSTYILRDASWLAIYDFEGNCTENGYVTNREILEADNTPIKVDLCSIILFDVNGARGPNTPGEDRFAYYLADMPVDNSYLIPIGYRGETDKNQSPQYNSNGFITSTIGNSECVRGTLEGYNCTAQMMINNWSMEGL